MILWSFYYNATTIQQLDSFLRVLKTTTSKTEKLNCLYTLSYEYGLIDPRKGMEYGKQCLALALHENDLLFQLNGYNGIANAYETLANFDSAKYFHRKSYEVAKKMGAPQRMALTIMNVAICYKQLGNYKQALSEYLAGYKLLEKEPSYNPRIHFYLGEIYLRMGDVVLADYHSRLGIKKCKEFNLDYVMYNMYVNLAKCHQYNAKLDSAVFVLTEALVGLKSNTDLTSIGICLNALGEVYLGKKEYEKAFGYFLEEQQLQQKINNENGVHLAYLNMAYALAQSKKKNVSQILTYVKLAEKNRISIKTNHDILLESHLKAAKIHELINEPQNALNYYKQYYRLNDSLLNRDKMQQVLELQTKYETEKKEQQINILKQNDQIKSLEIKSQESEIRKRNLLIVFVLCLFALIGFLVYNSLQKQKQKQAFEKELAIKATEEKERLRLAKDIHDDLGSGLSKINFLSELIMQNKLLSNEIKENSASIVETSKKLIVNMRDLIWALDPENVTLEGLLTRLREYSSDYMEDFPADLKLKISEDVPSVQISKESYRGILMIVKEALNNIVKHSKATIVEIEAVVSNELLFVSVNDNGIGMSKESASGNGLRNMRTRMDSIGGDFSVESSSEKGTKIIVQVPIKKIMQS